MQKSPVFTFQEIKSELVNLGDEFFEQGNTSIDSFSFKSLRKIEPGGIYFLTSGVSNAPHIEKSIIICSEGTEVNSDNYILKVSNPQLSFYKLMEKMLVDEKKKRGIHHTAIIGENCLISPDAYIGPYCFLENCIVKSGSLLHSHVTLMSGTTIEENVTIESYSVIGATGVAWVWDPATRRRVVQPQTGYTCIGSNSFLGSDVTVVRGSINETTIIGEGCVIAHGSKIGHGSNIGDECHFANNISIAGNVTLGKQCFLGSGSIVRPQTKLAERTIVGAGAVVVKHFDEPGQVLMGAPAKATKPASERMSGVPKPLDY